MGRPVAEVQAEVAGLGVNADKRQLEQLARALRDGERVIDYLTGRPQGGRYLGIFVSESRAIGVGEYQGVADIYWRDVAGIEVVEDEVITLVGYAGHKVEAHFDFGLFSRGVNRDKFRQFIDRVQDRVGALRAASEDGPSLAGELERLEGLRTRDALTEEEFQVAKRKLLAP